MLKSFPDNGPGLKKQEIEESLKEIKSQIKELKTEAIISFDDVKQNTDEFDGNKLLGEFLGVLRTNKQMSVLMVCRQISKIRVENGLATIYPNGEDDPFSTNEQAMAELRKFFKAKGLDCKIYKKDAKRDPVQELNEWVGGKLKIED